MAATLAERRARRCRVTFNNQGPPGGGPDTPAGPNPETSAEEATATDRDNRSAGGGPSGNGEMSERLHDIQTLFQSLEDGIRAYEEQRAAALHDYLQATLGDTEGYFHVVFTSEPYWDGQLERRHARKRSVAGPPRPVAQREILGGCQIRRVLLPEYVIRQASHQWPDHPHHDPRRH